MRQIVLDTETTGLEPEEGHRIIEIGALELIDRSLTGRQFHKYINPEREVDAGAVEVHGLSDEFLDDKPRFAEIAEEFIEFIRGAELIIHNAAFDVGFLDAELARLPEPTRVIELARVLDTLELARELHPGQRNSLDALCRRYEVDNSNRTLHGALLDSELLADVYLLMTGGQVDLGLDLSPAGSTTQSLGAVDYDPSRLRVRAANADECAAHEQRLQAIEQAAGESGCLWRTLAGRAS
ncbi:DNA polymerase III subunit epsilon [Wenzhouxiangella sp. XN79A]|uniref:DNA polymerase III subunit epsilon n=1 Tax=Wenzhouxiangella sp. XN79A TaxID=2724193 RepID=UPI00144A7DE6|nr:DNA polymerase III subunit epsilon [Wenzhouxiangella sp. XN79A]NKI33677.1 DNA polymerase III subunit epsilon [Wenzhouxiangella sp. XN79A]